METNYITLTKENIADEHICCAFSDKKCKESYDLKKEWLKREFDNGYVFRRIDARAKVFIEYGPAEKGWAPIDAANYLLINCFWVSGQYKGQGYAKELLRLALDDAVRRLYIVEAADALCNIRHDFPHIRQWGCPVRRTAGRSHSTWYRRSADGSGDCRQHSATSSPAR